MKISDFFNAVKNVVYPRNETCDLCGSELPFKNRLNLCSQCLEKLELNNGKVCLCCGSPVYNEADYCLRCENTSNVFRFNRSPLVYDGLAKKTVLTLKYGEKRYLSDFLAKLMTDEYLKDGINADVVTFVPMTKKEKRKRGFNQAELLAVKVADSLKLDLCDLLIKTRETTEQKKLSAKERAENMKGIFDCKSDLHGKEVLLVDDVFTTGATANECSKQLLKAGAKGVTVLTAAVTALKPYLS
ncbi:MAG: ComF family protein [Christensenellales bacterium]